MVYRTVKFEYVDLWCFWSPRWHLASDGAIPNCTSPFLETPLLDDPQNFALRRKQFNVKLSHVSKETQFVGGDDEKHSSQRT